MKKKILSSLLYAVLLCGALSTFVACKDYDDDINAVKSDVTSLRGELSSLKSSLESELQTVKAQLQTALDTKADKTEVAALTQRVAVLETKLATVDTAIANLQGDVAAAQTALNALTGRVGTTEETLAALQKNLDDQIAALTAWQAELQKWMDAVDAAEYQKQIDALKTDVNGLKDELEKYDTDLATLQKKVNDLEEKLGAVSVLEVLVNKMLTSIALLPALYQDGIEAIEFMSLKYDPVKPGTSGYTKDGATVIIDNGETEATYVLSPSTVRLESIDCANIAFKTAVAETRAANNYVADVVKFNGIKDFKNGLMTVKMKKANTSSLNRNDGKIHIVSLMVPRKADEKAKQEYAEIYSENSMLVENYFTPQIADATKALTTHATQYPGSAHFYDSTSVYKSQAGSSALVVKNIKYDEGFNLHELVKVCLTREGYSSNDKDASNTDRMCRATKLMTLDDIKAYGITVRFSVPKIVDYNNVNDKTNQQDFAEIDANGVVTSITPKQDDGGGFTNNKAVVGKEPIIRVDLVDTVHSNKLVDQRYFKIKWVEDEENAEPLEPKDLGNFDSKGTVGCKDITSQILWKDFINKVYAEAITGEGMSQETFERIYPIENYESKWEKTKNITLAGEKNGTALIEEEDTGLPVFGKGSAEADANICTWTLTPEQVGQVWVDDATNKKVFVVSVTIKSTQPTVYPDLYFTWTYTIDLPTLPEINGYYDQYWKMPRTDADNGLTVSDNSEDTYYVLPIQYQPTMPASAYCHYNNNLMNGFTYEQVNGTSRFIVKNMSECSTWDFQFSMDKQIAGYTPSYSGVEPLKTAGEPWATFGAYELVTTPGNVHAAQLTWDEGHASWCNNLAHYQTNLFIDHKTEAAYPLLNELSDEYVQTELGLTVPKFTEKNKVRVSVWATVNPWNYVPVKKYNLCIVAPLSIKAELEGAFEDGHIGGSSIDCSNAFQMVDFRGYTVAQTNGTTEATKYATALWKYYEIGDVAWLTENVKYAYDELPNGNIVINNDLTYDKAMSAARLNQLTNGGINLSIQLVGNNLVFKNNGGSDVTDMVYAFIPCQVTYGFGVATKYVKVPIYGTGQKAEIRKK